MVVPTTHESSHELQLVICPLGISYNAHDTRKRGVKNKGSDMHWMSFSSGLVSGRDQVSTYADDLVVFYRKPLTKLVITI